MASPIVEAVETLNRGQTSDAGPQTERLSSEWKTTLNELPHCFPCSCPIFTVALTEETGIFGLQVFCSGFLHLCSLVTLACNFLFW